ncbi:hypothetical protein LV469_02845 [Peptoniphilus sp. GNH]|nr:hypothetical protein LV469_02845 [Peptoniphilus sp. GNH]
MAFDIEETASGGNICKIASGGNVYNIAGGLESKVIMLGDGVFAYNEKLNERLARLTVQVQRVYLDQNGYFNKSVNLLFPARKEVHTTLLAPDNNSHPVKCSIDCWQAAKEVKEEVGVLMVGEKGEYVSGVTLTVLYEI